VAGRGVAWENATHRQEAEMAKRRGKKHRKEQERLRRPWYAEATDRYRPAQWIGTLGRVYCQIPDSSLVPVVHRALSLNVAAIRSTIRCSCGDEWGDALIRHIHGHAAEDREREIEALSGYFAHLMRANRRTIPPLRTWAWAMVRTRVAPDLWLRYERARSARRYQRDLAKLKEARVTLSHIGAPKLDGAVPADWAATDG
jgi:hypothetical protein